MIIPGKVPIVVFDSGSGGLSVLAELQKLMPGERYIYLGDHAYVPYGKRTSLWIRTRVIRILTWLSVQKPKLIILACNTATVAGISRYRKLFPEIPLIGAVPVVKTAAAVTKTKSVLILSTCSTARSAYQRNLISEFADGAEMQAVGSDRLVPLIESARCDKREIDAEIKRLVGDFKSKNVDVIALGCTHFPFIKDRIQKIVGAKVTLLDSGGAIARHAWRILEANWALEISPSGNCEYLTTGQAGRVSRVATVLTGHPVKFKKVAISVPVL